MKHKLLLALGALLTTSLVATGAAHAATNMRGGDVADVSKSEVLDSSFYGAGKHVTIAGTVKGDVYCAGQTVDITGTVEGDVLCAGQTVNITGKVEGSVRAVGQTVTVSGDVERSASLAGQTTTLAETAKVGRDLTMAGQTAQISGEVTRDVVSSSSATTLGARVGRSAQVFGDMVTLSSDARVQGNLNYTSHRSVQIDKGAVIAGHTTHNFPKEKAAPKEPKWRHQLNNRLYWLGSILLLGALFLLLMPRWSKKVVQRMQTHALASFGLGLAGLILTPIVAGIVAVTLIGVPLSIVLVVDWLFAMIAGFTVTAYMSGEWLVRQLGWQEKWRDAAGLVTGAVVLMILSCLPLIGWLVVLIALLWGLGGLYLGIGQAIRDQHVTPPKAGKSKAKA